MFDTVLVANRGEIASRIMRTLRRIGVRSVAVYSDEDRSARHVREADVAIRLGPASASESYLSIDRIMAAASESRRPGHAPRLGFLAENANFAKACRQAGLDLHWTSHRRHRHHGRQDPGQAGGQVQPE